MSDENEGRPATGKGRVAPAAKRGVMFHPNSVFARSDKKTKTLARKRMKAYYADQKMFRAWANNGFVSGAESHEVVYEDQKEGDA